MNKMTICDLPGVKSEVFFTYHLVTTCDDHNKSMSGAREQNNNINSVWLMIIARKDKNENSKS